MDNNGGRKKNILTTKGGKKPERIPTLSALASRSGAGMVCADTEGLAARVSERHQARLNRELAKELSQIKVN